MIKKKCFEKNWIIQKHKELKADPILVEKAICNIYFHSCIIPLLHSV
jgi:hypothetical protein